MFGLSVSLDGFIADKNDDVSLVFAWFASAWDRPHEVMGDAINESGAVIMGHRGFDQIYSEQGWAFPDGTAPDWPVIVLQSHARASEQKGKTRFFFVTDGIESAMMKARELSGEKNVALHGATAVQQALKAGLVNEFHLNIAPVLLGEGVSPLRSPRLSADPPGTHANAGDTGSNPSLIPCGEIRLTWPHRVSGAA